MFVIGTIAIGSAVTASPVTIQEAHVDSLAEAAAGHEMIISVT